MANQKRKLESFLKQPNPKVCNTYSWEGSLTETRGSSPQAADMVAWPDFEYKNLIGKFCRFLNHEYDNQYLPVFGESLPFHLTEVRNEDTLEALLIRWNHAVVSTALELAQRKSNSTISDPDTDPEEIFMARGGHGWIPDTNVTQKGCHPDWAGIQRSKPEEIKVGGQKRVSYVNMLPGDSKLSTKWNTKLYEKNK